MERLLKDGKKSYERFHLYPFEAAVDDKDTIFIIPFKLRLMKLFDITFVGTMSQGRGWNQVAIFWLSLRNGEETRMESRWSEGKWTLFVQISMSGNQRWWITNCTLLEKLINRCIPKCIYNVGLDRRWPPWSLPALGHLKGLVVATVKEAVTLITPMMLSTE